MIAAPRRNHGDRRSHASRAVEANYDRVDTSRWRCRLCPFDLGHRRGKAIGAWAGACRRRLHTPVSVATTGLIKPASRGNGARLRLANRNDRGTAYTFVDGGGPRPGLAPSPAPNVGHHGRPRSSLVGWRESPRNVATERPHTLQRRDDAGYCPDDLGQRNRAPQRPGGIRPYPRLRHSGDERRARSLVATRPRRIRCVCRRSYARATPRPAPRRPSPIACTSATGLPKGGRPRERGNRRPSRVQRASPWVVADGTAPIPVPQRQCRADLG